MADPKKFPVYKFTAKWTQDGDHNPEYPKMHEGLPDGRVWNWTCGNKMFKEMLTQEQIQEQIQELTQQIISENLGEPNYKNVADLVVTLEFSSMESWVLTWFQHETIDVGQTDAEVLDSFAAFVNEKSKLNRCHRQETGEDMDIYCLMGAEDRWRWHGANEDGSTNDSGNIPAPCRCKHCKAQGKIRIGH